MEYRLGDCIEKIIDNRGKNPKYYAKEKYPVIDNVLIKNTLYPNMKDVNRYINQETYDNFLRDYLEKDLPIMTLVGSGIGNVSLSPSKNVAIVQNTIGFKTKYTLLNSVYLYYWFLIKHQELVKFNRGSGQPSIKKTDIEEMKINLPNIEIQDKIVKILFTIDKKIELNNQINDNLYEIMKLNFNQWVENLKDYELSNLSSIAYYKNGLAMQKYRPLNDAGLPVIKIKEMNSGISSETEKCKSNIDKDVIVNNGDVLFAWSGTLCMTIWSGGKAGLNQHIFKVTSDKYPKWFYYFWTLKHLDNFIQIAAGKATTMGHIKRGELDSSEVLIPNENELKKMNNIMAPMLDKYISNKVENEMLIKLRDTLLPKLMNGEIDLSNIEV